MNHRVLKAVACLAVALSAAPATSAEITKFGKTCIGNFGLSKSVCLSSNGKTISSSYRFRGTIPTKGTHTGCSLKGSSIACSGGTYMTSQGSGKMGAVVVKLSKGKPVSIAWR